MLIGLKTSEMVPFKVHPYAALFKRGGLYVCCYDYRRIDDRQYTYSRELASKDPSLIRDAFIASFHANTVLRFNDWLQQPGKNKTAHCPPAKR